ncbi:MAG: translocation/assembly module TamB, partial [Spirochaetaceae bacterium]|nr:translocation/assembly module TamB [Spirochaetaceae bacterium]
IKKEAHGSIDCSVEAKGAFDYASFDWNNIDFLKLPEITFEAKLVKGEYKAVPVLASAKGKVSNGIIEMAIPKIEYESSKVEDAKITASLLDGSVGLACNFRTVIGNERLETGLLLNGSIRKAGTADTLSGGASGISLLSGYSAEFAGIFQNLKYGETLLAAWEFSGKYEEGNFIFAGEKDSVKLALKNDGAFEASLGGSLPIKAKVKGQLSGDSIEASLDDLVIDLTALNPIMPDKTMSIDSGKLSGSLSMKGLIADPEINGSLLLDNAFISTGEALVGQIGPVSASVNFQGKDVTIPETIVPFDKGSLSVSASASLEQWSLNDLKLNLQTQEGSELALNRTIGPILLEHVLAKVNLGLTIDDGVLSVDGSVHLEKGQISINMEALAASAPKPATSASPLEYRVNVALTFGKQLEVYFPDRSIPILRGFMAPTSKLQIVYDSASQNYSLNGQIDFRSGYFFYYMRNFFIKSATLYFDEDSTKFNPLFSLSAELRESGSLGLVKITLSADKAPFNDLRLQLRSDPSMNETQLIALMAGGVLSTDTSQSLGLRETAIASSEFIPQLRFMSTFEEKIQKALGLDIVLIRSTFIQRWLMDITKPQGTPLPEDPLARYLDQSSLYFGKYITDSAFLYGNLMFRENPLVSSSRLRLDSELGIEFDTPFGLLNWSLLPTYRNSSFDVGQQLSLSWRYVY